MCAITTDPPTWLWRTLCAALCLMGAACNPSQNTPAPSPPTSAPPTAQPTTPDKAPMSASQRALSQHITRPTASIEPLRRPDIPGWSFFRVVIPEDRDHGTTYYVVRDSTEEVITKDRTKALGDLLNSIQEPDTIDEKTLALAATYTLYVDGPRVVDAKRLKILKPFTQDPKLQPPRWDTSTQPATLEFWLEDRGRSSTFRRVRIQPQTDGPPTVDNQIVPIQHRGNSTP